MAGYSELMTEQEVEGFGERLKLIWQPERSSVHYSQFGKFSFTGHWRGGLYLRIEDEGELSVELVLGKNLLLTLFYGEIEENEKHKNLVDQWRLFFRRGCWLSGCDVEASAHEKAEWMQGFTPEEIEAWNTRF